ncbi:hypothetical protein V757_06365 [Pelistega indica]|uniref:Endolytic murein transglycosylase n=1 Tax=Pelistega indica TaxID=1414851 RepID=V8G7N7_9BURK|nr:MULTISPECIES: endolytic transglycosylase MltG [Pelistega]ETD71707.1 hypothetical protein V757_06365 [Pelistega indica]
MIKKLIIFIVFIISVMAGIGYYQLKEWQTTPLKLTKESVMVKIPKGSSIKNIADILIKNNVPVNNLLFTYYARYTGQVSQLKAGTYEIKQGQTAPDVLAMIANGEVAKRTILFVEGWTYKQIRQAITQHPDIEKTLSNITDQELLKKLNAPDSMTSMEGLLFPNTYVFTPGDSDFMVIQQAYQEGQNNLKKNWDNRAENLPFKTPYEALILASIVEKETGHGEDRKRIAGVFINRLKANMLLQTDPTVIYGMGDKYQNKIRKVDLQTDTPWNTYTRKGLPPTPIASSGDLALKAVLHPENHHYFYFVSRGDGTSEFAENLPQHNQNVQKFILKQGQK